MRLVRLDHLPGGRSIELHPRLTTVLGAPAEVREALESILRALAAGEPVAHDGQAELHGIRVSLRDRSFDVAPGPGGPSWVDPVLDLAAPTPLRPAGGRLRRGGPTAGRPRTDGPVVEMRSTDDVGSSEVFSPLRPSDGPTTPIPASSPPSVTPPTADPDPAQHTRRIASEDLVRLRAELRSLDGERAVLARAAEEVRSDLDSFARATLEVAIGQLEAVEERRAAAEQERAGWVSEHADRRAELVTRAERLRAELAALPEGGTEAVRDALRRLAAVREPTGRPDPAAQTLAAELEDLRRSMEDLETRRMAIEGFLADAEAQLAEAEREAEAARNSIRSPDLHPAVVRQLEAVRDEIFELEERGGRVAAVRARRRIDELRSEEALLLDQLGFDTYTAFVMGTPNRETESVRAIRTDRAVARVEQLSDEVDRLRQELPGGAEDRWNRAERTRIVGEAAALLDTTAEGLARLTTAELVELLNTQQERPTPQASADVLAASGRLAAALVAAGAPSPGAAADPAAMQELAEQWLADEEARQERRAALERSIEEAEQERERLDESTRRADDGGRVADLDAELRALRARVADGEARVARHERATAELADLRAQELELRDRERDLLVRISDRERLLSVLGGDVPPPEAPAGEGAVASPSVDLPEPEPVRPGTTSPPPDAEALRRVVDRDASVAWPVDREWQLLSRLGEVRAVGTVGALPLLLCGIDAAAVDAPALLHRIASMSELVQMVVLADDERLGRWTDGLGSDARLIRW
ncbi:hypothetical protein [Dermatobacter hominis]|uniref:hypothetical protein n=1 Tax=Dermatobacter hominis TaxID=2884263 RepID=UPI001D11CFED|nr:hypothetical protein [Dermatobacter hominis]UDY35943.1 hypothetical protein LH044_00025 [Dermatobacter hominis]